MFSNIVLLFCILKIANSQWFASLPELVHACFYNYAVQDPQTLVAFAHCQQTDGGEKCIKNIPAAVICMNKNGHEDRHEGFGLNHN